MKKCSAAALLHGSNRIDARYDALIPTDQCVFIFIWYSVFTMNKKRKIAAKKKRKSEGKTVSMRHR